MEICKIALFGQSDFSAHRKLEEKLLSLLRSLLEKNDLVEILIGRDCEFDIFVAALIKRIQKVLDAERITLSLVLPNCTGDIELFAAYYDAVVVPSCVAGALPAEAITKRNRYMAEKCNLFACFINRAEGDAYDALLYAQSLGKTVVNFACNML